MAIGREGSGHILVWVNEMNRRDFGNGENNQLGITYVEFELPSGFHLNIMKRVGILFPRRGRMEVNFMNHWVLYPRKMWFGKR